jgi:hypothetical protein
VDIIILRERGGGRDDDDQSADTPNVIENGTASVCEWNG